MKRSTALSFVSLFLFSILPATRASALDHLWSERFGGPDHDTPESVTISNAGNVIVAGHFDDTIQFGGVYHFSAGAKDAFVAQFDVLGACQWSKRFGSTGGDRANAVAVDGSGNVIVTGHFSGTVDFGGGNLTSAGGEDIFLAKFDSDGNHLWSHRYGSISTTHEAGIGVVTDGSGNVFLTGRFYGATDFGGGSLVNSNVDVFLAKYDASGVHQWSRRFGGNSFDTPYAIAIDASGGPVITGEFRIFADFGGINISGFDFADVFLARYDGDGNHQWSKAFGGDSFDFAYGVGVDGAGNVFLGGFFRGTANLGGGDLSSASAGEWDIFVASYDATGAHRWSQRFGSVELDAGYDVTVSTAGNVFLTGYFGGGVDFGGGNLTSVDDDDIFLASFDSNGNHLWSQRHGGLGGDDGRSIAVDNAGRVVLAGTFAQGVDFGGGVLGAVGISDMYVATLANAPTGVGGTPSAHTIDISAYPNPFNPRTTLSYSLPAGGPVSVTIHDVHGSTLAVLVDHEERGAGVHRTEWDGRTDGGTTASSGVYFARVEQAGVIRSTRLVLLK